MKVLYSNVNIEIITGFILFSELINSTTPNDEDIFADNLAFSTEISEGEFRLSCILYMYCFLFIPVKMFQQLVGCASLSLLHF